jgi:type II secretory pathway pseudopilin PulG
MIIVGVLMAIAVPMYFGQRARAKDASVKEDVHTVLVAVQSYAVEHDDTWPDEAAGQLEAQVSSQVLPWPQNPSRIPSRS